MQDFPLYTLFKSTSNLHLRLFFVPVLVTERHFDTRPFVNMVFDCTKTDQNTGAVNAKERKTNGLICQLERFGLLYFAKRNEMTANIKINFNLNITIRLI